ncbi:hypothetical protein STIAU_1044, partial [Stigmatella aurantiaca DW4/3-1]
GGDFAPIVSGEEQHRLLGRRARPERDQQQRQHGQQ